MHPVLALYRRNAWATSELLRFCAGLPPEVLARPDPDVYGSIEASFNHILGAESRYLRRLTGDEPRVNENAPLPLAELQEPAADCAARWEALLASDLDVDTVREHERGDIRFRMADWVAFVQAVHHGDDHRTQINTLLGRQGVEAPDLDGWSFGEQPQEGGTIGAGAERLLGRFFGHHLWATHRALMWAMPIPEEQAQVAAQGTYGTIEATLEHLVFSDRVYLAGLDAWDWRDWLAGDPDFDAVMTHGERPGPAWVIALQAIHHGNDHRTHLGTLALANRLPELDLDVWTYAQAVGAYTEL